MIRKAWFLGLVGASLLSAFAGCTTPLEEAINGLSGEVSELGDQIDHLPPPGDVNVYVDSQGGQGGAGGAGGDGGGVTTPTPTTQPAVPQPQERPDLPEGLLAWLDEGVSGLDWTCTLGVWDSGFTEGYTPPQGWTAEASYTLTLYSGDGTLSLLDLDAEDGLQESYQLDPAVYDPSQGCVNAVLVLTYTQTGQQEVYSVLGGCR